MERRREMDVYYLMWGGALLAGEARRAILPCCREGESCVFVSC